MVEPSCFLVSAWTNQTAALNSLDQSDRVQLDINRRRWRKATLFQRSTEQKGQWKNHQYMPITFFIILLLLEHNLCFLIGELCITIMVSWGQFGVSTTYPSFYCAELSISLILEHDPWFVISCTKYYLF